MRKRRKIGERSGVPQHHLGSSRALRAIAVKQDRAGPPDGCGGIPGFHAALDALADPEHPEHAEVMAWLDG
jgi:hypothetical protein